MDATKLAMANDLADRIATLESRINDLNHKTITHLAIVYKDNKTEFILLGKESRKLIANYKKTKELELQALEQQFKKL